VRKQLKRKIAGFTIMELAIVVIIAGIMMTAGIAITKTQLDQSRYNATATNLKTIKNRMALHRTRKGAYLCPAIRDLPLDDANFGIADTSADCNNTVSAGADVRIGTIPTRTLGIPDAMMFDGYGNRLTYAVSTDLTNAITFDKDQGKVEIKDSRGEDVVDAHFVIVSHGKNGRGSYKSDGSKHPLDNCSNNNDGLDVENCNDEQTFRKTINFSNKTGATYFDDLVSYPETTLTGPVKDAMCIVLPPRVSGGPPIDEAGPFSYSKQNCDILGTDWEETGEFEAYSGAASVSLATIDIMQGPPDLPTCQEFPNVWCRSSYPGPDSPGGGTFDEAAAWGWDCRNGDALFDFPPGPITPYGQADNVLSWTESYDPTPFTRRFSCEKWIIKWTCDGSALPDGDVCANNPEIPACPFPLCDPARPIIPEDNCYLGRCVDVSEWEMRSTSVTVDLKDCDEGTVNGSCGPYIGEPVVEEFSIFTNVGKAEATHTICCKSN